MNPIKIIPKPDTLTTVLNSTGPGFFVTLNTLAHSRLNSLNLNQKELNSMVILLNIDKL